MSGRTSSRGAVALPIVGLVALLLLLLAGLVHGNLLAARRLATHQWDATRANEAAEAGVAWLLAHINQPAPVDDACRTAEVGGAGFIDRFAGVVDADGRWTPPAARGQCAQAGDGWACRCPSPSAAAASAPLPSDGPSFAVQLHPARRPDLLQLVADGCSGPVAPCPSNADDARARITVSVARLPALRHLPAAALTVPGRVTLGAAPWTLAAAGGAPLALHTGGAVTAPRLVLSGAPGAPAGSLQRTGDATLHDGPPSDRFAAQFHLAPRHWQTLPAVRRIDCHTPCDDALRQAGRADAPTLLWLDGGLHTAAPLTLGAPDRPVLLVADGPVRAQAALTVHGLLHLRAADWRSPAGLHVLGAVTAEGDLHADGPATVRVAPAALDTLRRHAGAFLRVPGSWRDFE